MESEYDIIIERGHSNINDEIMDYIIPHVKANYLDVGCNTGWLLDEVINGSGVEQSNSLGQIARSKGHDVFIGDFLSEFISEENKYDQVVLSCVLQHNEYPDEILKKALRIAKNHVLGVCPIPNKSEWGILGTNPWTKSVTSPKFLERVYKAEVHPIGNTLHYFFIIKK